MRLMIWTGDEGPTDLDLKDGDVWAVHLDTWVPGTQEAKKWLNVQMEEYGGDQNELSQPEYSVVLPSGPVQRHARKYFIPYWEKLTPEELALVRNKELTKEVMIGKFNVWDITRK